MVGRSTETFYNDQSKCKVIHSTTVLRNPPKIFLLQTNGKLIHTKRKGKFFHKKIFSIFSLEIYLLADMFSLVKIRRCIKNYFFGLWANFISWKDLMALICHSHLYCYATMHASHFCVCWQDAAPHWLSGWHGSCSTDTWRAWCQSGAEDDASG